MAKTLIDENNAYEQWKSARFEQRHFIDLSKREAHLRQAEFLAGGNFDPQPINHSMREAIEHLQAQKRIPVVAIKVPYAHTEKAAKGWLSFFGRKPQSTHEEPRHEIKPGGPKKGSR